MIKIRASPQRCEKLYNTCKILNITILKPILDVETRWNSTYDMIKRAIILKNVSFLYILNKNFCLFNNINYIFRHLKRLQLLIVN